MMAVVVMVACDMEEGLIARLLRHRVLNRTSKPGLKRQLSSS